MQKFTISRKNTCHFCINLTAEHAKSWPAGPAGLFGFFNYNFETYEDPAIETLRVFLRHLDESPISPCPSSTKTTTRGNSKKLLLPYVCSSIRKSFCTIRIRSISDWNSLPVSVVSSPNFHSFKRALVSHTLELRASAGIMHPVPPANAPRIIIKIKLGTLSHLPFTVTVEFT